MENLHNKTDAFTPLECELHGEKIRRLNKMYSKKHMRNSSYMQPCNKKFLLITDEHKARKVLKQLIYS